MVGSVGPQPPPESPMRPSGEIPQIARTAVAAPPPPWPPAPWARDHPSTPYPKSPAQDAHIGVEGSRMAPLRPPAGRSWQDGAMVSVRWSVLWQESAGCVHRALGGPLACPRGRRLGALSSALLLHYCASALGGKCSARVLHRDDERTPRSRSSAVAPVYALITGNMPPLTSQVGRGLQPGVAP